LGNRPGLLNNHRTLVPLLLALVALFCVTFACSCSEDNARDSNIDLTAYLDDMQRLCSGAFEGQILDQPGSSSSVEYEPCEHDGEAYHLEVDVVSELYCYNSEDVEGVDCTHAQTGLIELVGSLAIGADTVLDLEGHASIQQVRYRDAPTLSCLFSVLDDTVPYQTFEAIPDAMPLDQDDLELFSWGRRHTIEDVEPVVWEVCELSVETHE
jgi:hypothetical protein